jgi:hypothetical protein
MVTPVVFSPTTAGIVVLDTFPGIVAISGDSW